MKKSKLILFNMEFLRIMRLLRLSAVIVVLFGMQANVTLISSGQVTLDFILDERARELVTEEHRRHTLLRTNKLIERTRLYNHITSGERGNLPGIQSHNVLLPFPQRIIDANVGRPMDQNAGY